MIFCCLLSEVYMNSENFLSQEEAWSLALQQASRGLGRVSPNPPVGAVLLSPDGKFLSMGYHEEYGGKHAEILALESLKSHQIKGATLYVTLEPCSHEGHTPSCAQHIAQLPLKKVCIGLMDPSPRVHGKGIEILKNSPIEVEIYEGPLKKKLEELIEVFTYNSKTKKPFLGIKIASSLDGSIVIPQRRWLTGESARSHVAFLRGHHDAVCIGVQTLLNDNPRLNSRHPDFIQKENTVIILDPLGQSFSFLEKSNLLQVREPRKVIILTTPQYSQKSSCRVLEYPVNKEGWFVDLEKILKDLFDQGIYSCLVEGGGITFSHFLPLSQRFYLFLAPLVAGSVPNSKNWTEFVPSLSLQNTHYTAFEQDVLITGQIFPYKI